FAAGGGGAHPAPVRARDRLHHGRGPIRARGHLVGGAGRHRGGGGGNRGARLALHRLQVHDAGRGGGQHVGGAVRGGFGRPGGGPGLAADRGGARAQRRGGGDRGRGRGAGSSGGRGGLAGPVVGRGEQIGRASC